MNKQYQEHLNFNVLNYDYNRAYLELIFEICFNFRQFNPGNFSLGNIKLDHKYFATFSPNRNPYLDFFVNQIGDSFIINLYTNTAIEEKL